MLSFPRCVLPLPEILSRAYLQGLCKLVKISRCLVIPDFPRHGSRSFLQCTYHKSDIGSAHSTARAVHSHSKWDVVGVSVHVLYCLVSQAQQIGCVADILFPVHVQTICATHVPQV